MAVEQPRIKGWCPGAWRPMPTGDGLLVRIRPPLGQLTRIQMLALCEAAERFGSGLIELTNRANLQLRGVSEAVWRSLMAFLVEHALVDPDPRCERLPPLLLAPDWQAGDATHEVARLLSARRDELPELPGKIGFAIDASGCPLLSEVSADFRLEQSAAGTLLVRADGYDLGTPVPSVDAAVEQLIRLAHWFVESGGRDAGRMCRHDAPLPSWALATQAPARARDGLALGSLVQEKQAQGMLLGLPFGRVAASVLRTALEPESVTSVRVTPWRRLLIIGAPAMPVAGLLHDNRDPRLSMDACPGSPYCEQASVATLGLAEGISRLAQGTLHVSGCSKGCARRQAAEVSLVGRGGRYDVVLNGRADGTPDMTGLSESDVIAYLKNRLEF
ncbi:cobalamin biosynthesis protein CobG [Halomonas binhaiensis]|uniref:Cobalamin biosynthesis protein CobG n=1 Tax=Halomonas binhaiensis TaxID=2562282 RepID=A0A5C1NI75_9GAMM|nr:cobalamin biosynthesis protein CobG [Halomonas binhaiensis]QEM81439.1 cobalamin biosynthesis protein CobG [Halomonas binhaiensis]